MDIGGRLKELFSLEGKVILITGAGGAIGSEMAIGVAQVGAKVILSDVNDEGMRDAESRIRAFGGEALCIHTDMLSLDSIKSCVAQSIERFGKIDVLINCAGINKRIGCMYGDEETFDRIVGVNLKGVYFMSQEVAKHMAKAHQGSIINIASYNAVMMLGGCGVYGATKSGVAALTRAQAIEWAKHGIRSNAIAPGHIKTSLTTPLWENPKLSRFLLDRIAMARPGTPSDLIGITILLASDASCYMSGMMYHVDGGCLAGGQPWEIENI
jgi:gluconate 5-dehydrogenase